MPYLRLHSMPRTSALAIAALLTCVAMATVSLQRAEAAKPDKRPTVAIVYFDYDGDNEEMATLRKGIAQMLISDLSHLNEVRMVERSRLQEIIDELKLSRTKTFDKATAAKIGKLLGAKYMVLGGYFSVMGSMRIDARVVEVETGRIVRSVGAHAKAEDFMTLESTVASQLETLLTSDAIVGFSKTAASTRTPKRPKRKYKRPAKLKTKTAVRYAQALDARDNGDVEAERLALAAVVKDAPDFGLAAAELQGLIQ